MRAADPQLVAELAQLVGPSGVLARPIDRLGRSADASIYRLIPEAIVRPRDLDAMRALFGWAHRARRGLTFRAAGTSLSGQAVTRDVLVELAHHWRTVTILDGGTRVRAQPAVVGGHVNRLLAPLGRRLGPDPASIDAAMIGGILANNASGMCCGVAENSYRTLESARLLLADGSELDTGAADADARLHAVRPDLHAGLLALRDAVHADPTLAARVRSKFATKNTTGYSLNAFLDFEAPAAILAHLMVGSQGTLAFVAEATLRTVEEPPERATALLYFAELTEAGAAVAPLAALGAAAVEIMDAASLRSQAGERHYPFAIAPRTAALLVELRARETGALEAGLVDAEALVASLPLLAPARFTRDADARAEHWRLRKGLYPSVGALRPQGTAVVIEDVAVPVARLAEAIADLQQLFARHGYAEAIVFGHAKDGNLHFVLAEDFGRDAAVSRYAAFMQDLVELVVGKYDGALKAEHASGRNMAPFVEREWGAAAYDVMRRLKRLLDPAGILNPGVLLNDDPQAHLRDLKPLPAIAASADRCIECGFCEPRCPSRALTLTPRQRIVVVRELERLRASAGAEAAALVRELQADFDYEGLHTCAGDSMCQTSCPVKIDTGALVKELKASAHPAWARRAAGAAATRFGSLARAARLGLELARALRAVRGGAALVSAGTGLLHRLAPTLVPHVMPALALPRAAPALPRVSSARGEARVVYFPSCLTRIVGALPGETAPALAPTLVEVLAEAGFAPVYPERVERLCCGMPFASKGFPGAAAHAARASLDALWQASAGGRLAVVTDASPCAGTLRQALVDAGDARAALRVLDFPAFWAREALPRLAGPKRRPGRAVLHPTCTLIKAGEQDALLAVARAHAEEVVVPASAECCGFAGDRGFLVPELTASATRDEAAELAARIAPGTGFYSTCRTCEIGMSRSVGQPYRSLVHLVHEALCGPADGREPPPRRAER